MLPIVHERIRIAAARERNLRLIRKRIKLRNESRPFDLSEARFKELFRLNKEMVRQLIEVLRPHLEDRASSKGVSFETKVLTALRFYSVGCYQRCIGQDFNNCLSQTTVHRCVKSVTQALANIAPEYIVLPNTQEERNVIKAEFMNKWGFPGVIGAIDCTHIAILKPQVEEHNYINRKGYHSLNVQVTCDPSLKITSLFANFGGSTHDSFIWRNSHLKFFINQLNAAGERCWLIGDSGYPLEAILMTPIRDPQNPAEERYNNAHVRARNSIERCFGVLKNRFRCLLRERSARYSPNFMCDVIKACAVLHNMCIQEHFINEDEIIEQQDVPDNLVNNNVPVPEGVQVRNRIVNQYFLQN